MTPAPGAPASGLRGLDQRTYLDHPELKQRYVTAMFDVIAPAYDRFTRMFSFGMDHAWKQELVAMAKPYIACDARILDLACGTGDIAIALARLAPHGEVLGLDAAPEMISQARSSEVAAHLPQLGFTVGDICAMAVADASQDVVSIGYGLRNVPDLERAIAEIARVLRPGGILICLDFTRPTQRWWRRLFLGYLLTMGNIYGVVLHGHAAVYGYIAHSIERFVSSSDLSRRFATHGLQVLSEQPKLGGGVCLHLARKVPCP